ncbi:MAG: hypothetical protein HZR80_21135 [Candidatus Heimdallarchaeota archaeon]
MISESTYPFVIKVTKNEREFWVVDDRTGVTITKRTIDRRLAEAYAKQMKQKEQEGST